MLSNIFFNTGGTGEFKYRNLDLYDPSIEEFKNRQLIDGGMEYLAMPPMVKAKNKLNLKLPDGYKYVVAIDPGSSKLGFAIGLYDSKYPYVMALFKRDNARLEEKGESAKFRENFREFFDDFMEMNYDRIVEVTMESPFNNYMGKKSKSSYAIIKAVYDDIKNISMRHGINLIPVKPQEWKSYFLRAYGERVLSKEFGIYDVNLTRSNKDLIFLVASTIFKDIKLSEEGAISDACDALGILWFYYAHRSEGEDGSAENPYQVIKSMDRCYKHNIRYRFMHFNNVNNYVEAVLRERNSNTIDKWKSSFVVRNPQLSLEDNIRSMTTKYKTDIFIAKMEDTLKDIREILKRREEDQTHQLDNIYVVFYRER